MSYRSIHQQPTSNPNHAGRHSKSLQSTHSNDEHQQLLSTVEALEGKSEGLTLAPKTILHLQRTVGNRAVMRMLNSSHQPSTRNLTGNSSTTPTIQRVVNINTPPSTKVWVSARDSTVFAEVATVTDRSKSRANTLVVVFDNRSPNQEYYMHINDLDYVTNARLPSANTNGNQFQPLQGSRPLTFQEAQNFVATLPNLFNLDDGTPTVDFNRDQLGVTQQLNTTHVRAVDGAAFVNCIDFAIGGRNTFLKTLSRLLRVATNGGMTVLGIGAAGADADLWGMAESGTMTVQHGTRRLPNGLWGSQMGAGANIFLTHTRNALTGGQYGQIIASVSGGRADQDVTD
jgi:hypothetical protein